MEPLIHFIVPFSALTLGGVKHRRAFLFAVLSLIPDLDVLFRVHRSWSHSLVVLLLTFIPLLVLFWKSKQWKDGILAFLVLSLHSILDIFSHFTPLFWPLCRHSFYILFESTVHIGSEMSFNLNIKVLTRLTGFVYLESFDAFLFTGEGLILVVVLLSPILLKILNSMRFRKMRSNFLWNGGPV